MGSWNRVISSLILLFLCSGNASSEWTSRITAGFEENTDLSIKVLLSGAGTVFLAGRYGPAGPEGVRYCGMATPRIILGVLEKRGLIREMTNGYVYGASSRVYTEQSAVVLDTSPGAKPSGAAFLLPGIHGVLWVEPLRGSSPGMGMFIPFSFGDWGTLSLFHQETAPLTGTEEDEWFFDDPRPDPLRFRTSGIEMALLRPSRDIRWMTLVSGGACTPTGLMERLRVSWESHRFTFALIGGYASHHFITLSTDYPDSGITFSSSLVVTPDAGPGLGVVYTKRILRLPRQPGIYLPSEDRFRFRMFRDFPAGNIRGSWGRSVSLASWGDVVFEDSIDVSTRLGGKRGGLDLSYTGTWEGQPGTHTTSGRVYRRNAFLEGEGTVVWRSEEKTVLEGRCKGELDLNSAVLFIELRLWNIPLSGTPSETVKGTFSVGWESDHPVP